MPTSPPKLPHKVVAYPARLDNVTLDVWADGIRRQITIPVPPDSELERLLRQEWEAHSARILAEKREPGTWFF